MKMPGGLSPPSDRPLLAHIPKFQKGAEKAIAMSAAFEAAIQFAL
jgi:hypothetical protein